MVCSEETLRKDGLFRRNTQKRWFVPKKHSEKMVCSEETLRKEPLLPYCCQFLVEKSEALEERYQLYNNEQLTTVQKHKLVFFCLFVCLKNPKNNRRTPE